MRILRSSGVKTAARTISQVSLVGAVSMLTGVVITALPARVSLSILPLVTGVIVVTFAGFRAFKVLHSSQNSPFLLYLLLLLGVPLATNILLRILIPGGQVFALDAKIKEISLPLIIVGLVVLTCPNWLTFLCLRSTFDVWVKLLLPISAVAVIISMFPIKDGLGEAQEIGLFVYSYCLIWLLDLVSSLTRKPSLWQRWR